ncbi:MAG: hypothetical protein JXB04_01865 [Kiritimatiellae bacterium]|nr:hypothetical protein [Kiritimatiellia bacterium]
MLEERDMRYLRASQARLVRVGEWILGITVPVFLFMAVRNLHLASVLASEQNTTIFAILNRGFQIHEHYPGQLLFTLERVNTGIIQILAAGLFATVLFIAASIRRRNQRILDFIAAHTPAGGHAPQLTQSSPQ